MKKYFKGFLSGLIVAVLLMSSVTVYANGGISQTIDVVMNKVNFTLNGKTISRAGENYTLSNGEKVPFSIVYNGTTYLPIRKVSEIMNMEVGWNGDTNTVTLASESTEVVVQETIEWKHGGYEADYPYKEYEYKYVNGVKTDEFRYTGNNKPYNGVPINFTSATVQFNSIGTPEAHFTAVNVGTKDIDAFEVDIYCYDNYDRPVNHYLYDTNIFKGISQDLITIGSTENNSYWTLYGHDNTTKIKIVLKSVHYTDGTTWEK